MAVVISKAIIWWNATMVPGDFGRRLTPWNRKKPTVVWSSAKANATG